MSAAVSISKNELITLKVGLEAALKVVDKKLQLQEEDSKIGVAVSTATTCSPLEIERKLFRRRLTRNKVRR